MAKKIFCTISYKNDKGKRKSCKAWLKNVAHLDAINYLKNHNCLLNPIILNVIRYKSRPHNSNYSNGKYFPKRRRRIHRV